MEWNLHILAHFILLFKLPIFKSSLLQCFKIQLLLLCIIIFRVYIFTYTYLESVLLLWVLFLLLRLLLDMCKYLGVLQDILIAHSTVKNNIVKEFHSRLCAVLLLHPNGWYNFMEDHIPVLFQYSDSPLVPLIGLKQTL